MTTIVAFVITITVLVFIHELGHYLAARSVGVRVERFSVLLPPRLFSFTSIKNGWEFKLFFFGKDEETGRLVWKPVLNKIISKPGRKGSLTEYTFALIPFGGYVKMSGMIDESMDSSIEHAPYELLSKPKWAQAWVMSAGVIMNVILAFVMFTWVTSVRGVPEISTEPVISGVLEGLPAQEIGLEAGDRVLEIDGIAVDTWEEMTNQIRPYPGKEVVLKWERSGTSYQETIIIGSDPSVTGDNSIGMLGVAPNWEFVPVGFFGSVKAGAISTVNGFGLIYMSLKMIVDGTASMKDIGGPIAIARFAGEAAELGWTTLVQFMALISVNLAFINILPVPGLDGGHLMVILVEAIRRKPLTVKTRLVIQQIGMAMLLLLIATIMYNDIWKLFAGN